MLKRVVISGLFLLLVLFSLPWIAIGQSTVINLLSGETVEINCEGNKLVFSRESRTKVLGLCQAEKPVPTDTPEPEPSDTPDPDPTDDPVADIPLCPDHDPTAWHPLYDAERECHYNHTHNADPSEVDGIFGPAAALYGGQTISYPWETPNENLNKHGGYKYSVAVKDECQREGFEYLGETNCVNAWRIQYHVVGGAMGANVRFHSHWSEVQVCTPDMSQCGTIKTGGWADFGILEVPYKTNIIPLPVDPDPVNQSIHAPPYRGHEPVDVAMGRGERGGDNKSVWTSANRYGYNKLMNFDFRVLDNWGGVNPENPSELHFICPDYQCKYNSSEHHVYAVKVEIPETLDDDNDGFVSYTGFTDRQGNLVDGCDTPGLDCVPLEIVGAPVGIGIFSRSNSGPRPPGEVIPDFDTSPPGEWWIEYPN